MKINQHSTTIKLVSLLGRKTTYFDKFASSQIEEENKIQDYDPLW